MLQVLLSACSTNKGSTDALVFIAGGTFWMGCFTNTCKENEVPIHQVTVAPFYMQKSPVTVAEFRAFITQTGYQTEAEKFGDAGVFDTISHEWALTKGANWQYPTGVQAVPAADKHPVTQVSWRDACSYCQWLGMRLPTEQEWEFAATNGATQKYAWGSYAVVNGQWQTNSWQGNFPTQNLNADGYLQTAPVGIFGLAPNGLTDMGGNVWQWCANSYALYNSPASQTAADTILKTIRGGSFLCDSNVCHGYQKFARNYCSAETSLMHLGFRCAQSYYE